MRRRGGRWVGGNGERRWRGAPRRRPLPSRCAGAHERRGAACADILPDTFPPFPVNGCRSGRESGSLRLPGWALSSSGWGRALKRAATPSAGSRAAPGARKRQGAARADLLPADSSPFPVKDCSSGRESGSLRLPGWAAAIGSGWAVGAGGRCDVDRRLPAARARASGEEQLVPTSSRLILRLSRLKVAVQAANLVRCG